MINIICIIHIILKFKIVVPVMPKMKNGKKYLTKTITLRDDQVRYVNENSINLSRFVQNKLDKLMGIKKVEK